MDAKHAKVATVIETLYICNAAWKVRISDEPCLVSERVVYGYTDADALEIVIGSKGLAQEQVVRTLIHEIYHAVIDSTVSTFPEDEEGNAHAIESGVFSIIRDPRNAWLWKFLRTKRAKK